MQFKIHKKENFYFIVMSAVSVLTYLALFYFLSVEFSFKAQITTYIYLSVILLAINFLMHLYFMGMIKGNAVKVNNRQFPEVYEILKNHSEKLNLKKVPEIYLFNGNGILNAFATRFAKRDYVILYSDIFELAYQEGIEALSFVIGHELGHIKRKHTSLWKHVLLFPASLIPFLAKAHSRACEHTSDNIGFSLCPHGSDKGILILAVGKKLYKNVNIDELLLSSRSEEGFATKFAEIFSTHPHLVKRLESISQLKNETLDYLTFVQSPRVDIKEKELN